MPKHFMVFEQQAMPAPVAQPQQPQQPKTMPAPVAQPQQPQQPKTMPAPAGNAQQPNPQAQQLQALQQWIGPQSKLNQSITALKNQNITVAWTNFTKAVAAAMQQPAQQAQPQAGGAMAQTFANLMPNAAKMTGVSA